RFVRLNQRDQVIVVGIAIGFEPAKEAHDRRQHVEQKVAIFGGLIDAPQRAAQHRRLDRGGVKRISKNDRILGEGVWMKFLLPQQHVRDEAVRLGALEQASNLLLGQLGIDTQQRDRVKARIPQPLKRVGL